MDYKHYYIKIPGNCVISKIDFTDCHVNEAKNSFGKVEFSINEDGTANISECDALRLVNKWNRISHGKNHYFLID